MPCQQGLITTHKKPTDSISIAPRPGERHSRRARKNAVVQYPRNKSSKNQEIGSQICPSCQRGKTSSQGTIFVEPMCTKLATVACHRTPPSHPQNQRKAPQPTASKSHTRIPESAGMKISTAKQI